MCFFQLNREAILALYGILGLGNLQEGSQCLNWTASLRTRR